MVAVLDLEQGQVTFNKLGVTLNLEESATGHHVIDLISGCADSITSGSGKRSRNESGKDSEDAIDNSGFCEFDLQFRESDQHGCEQAKSLIGGRWIARNLAADGRLEILRVTIAFLWSRMSVEKNQQMILPAPWTGRTFIEGKSHEFEGHVMRLTQSEELLIQKSCDKSRRGAECPESCL